MAKTARFLILFFLTPTAFTAGPLVFVLAGVLPDK